MSVAVVIVIVATLFYWSPAPFSASDVGEIRAAKFATKDACGSEATRARFSQSLDELTSFYQRDPDQPIALVGGAPVTAMRDVLLSVQDELNDKSRSDLSGSCQGSIRSSLQKLGSVLDQGRAR